MRNKIDYGIDLGTTNSAIARMENGKPKIIQTDSNKDTLPSCIAVNPRKNLIVGDAAYTANIKDKLNLLVTFENKSSNSFMEFKRSMGKDVTYYSSELDKDFNSEELSAEILKKLKSFVTDEQIKSIVITVPMMFEIPKNEATLRAAKLAGFEVIELLQEPIAASIAYGLDVKNKKGIWLVFDFGGGTFDAALVRVEEGIMKVLDFEGDNELGGKDLDFAIVDEIIIPYLKDKFSIDGILNDIDKKQILRNAMKSFAEKAKIELSFNVVTDITTFLTDIPAKDENGDQISLNLEISQEELLPVFKPFFQKAIEYTKTLLNKKGLKGTDLECLILVGGPTYSPILQKMLKEQITSNVIAKNQMTSVAIGAALYASTKDIGIKPPSTPTGTIALEIKYEAATVETDEMVNIKINSKDTTFDLPEKVYVVLDRADKSYSSDKVLINDRKSTLVEIILLKNEANYFSINLINEKGNKIPCQPYNFTILQGLKEPLAPLPYHIGIEVWDEKRKITVFKGFKGLEKNKILKNAVGTSPNLKTVKQLTPGIIGDVLRISIYQGKDGAENQNSFYAYHVTDVIISGETISKVIPANSDIEITLTFNENGALPICSVFFPQINHTEEIQIELSLEPKVDAEWLRNEINNDIKRLKKITKSDSNIKPIKISDELNELDFSLLNEQGSEEGKMKILNNLRRIRLVIDKYESNYEWPNVKQDLDDSFSEAKDLIERIKNEDIPKQLNMPIIKAHLEDFNNKIAQINKKEDVPSAKETIEEINDFKWALISGILPEGTREKGFIEYVDNNFGSITWTNKTKARDFINRAISNLNTSGDIDQLDALCSQIDDLIDRTADQPPIPRLTK